MDAQNSTSALLCYDLMGDPTAKHLLITNDQCVQRGGFMSKKEGAMVKTIINGHPGQMINSRAALEIGQEPTDPGTTPAPSSLKGKHTALRVRQRLLSEVTPLMQD